jgi:acetoacetyl-CoA synthetase
MEYSKVLWEPSEARKINSAMAKFAIDLEVLSPAEILEDKDAKAYLKLHRWSVENPALFWEKASDFLKLNWITPFSKVLLRNPEHASDPEYMRGVRWFSGGQLNYAENIFKGIGEAAHKNSILIGLSEGGERRVWSEERLKLETLYCQTALKGIGIKKGSIVCGVLSNVPESLIAMLGTTSLGAVWSSCSPDFGADGVLDRFVTLSPRILFLTKKYRYAGKEYSTVKMVEELVGRLKSVQHIVWIDHEQKDHKAEDQKKWEGQPLKLDTPTMAHVTQWDWSEWMAEGKSLAKSRIEPVFEPCDPNDPLFILFSSGTTGMPKCIVHSVLGTLLQHKKEHVLHCDMGPQDRLFYYTTCGWMMWNWMVSALASGTSLVMYDGAVVTSTDQQIDASGKPMVPSRLSSLWDLVAREQVTVFGTSPKFLSFCMSRMLIPKQDVRGHGFEKLRTILTTGSPLLPDHCNWVYESVAKDVHLASISGGTDIISCFMLGNPLTEVRAGEIQGPGLGMAVEAWSEQGKKIQGAKGELVCIEPFPSMPLGFWNDQDGKKYKEAYFDFFPGREVWRHGDFIEITPTGGVIVYGRSDATLNPGGIRIGSAEIYRQVESVPGILDSIVVGVSDGDDTPMALFVKLAPGTNWSEELVGQIKQRIRQHLTPRHIPKWILTVTDIPYTRSGKKMELAITGLLAGEPVKNLVSCANPECFDDYIRHKSALTR